MPPSDPANMDVFAGLKYASYVLIFDLEVARLD
jgi:hypothetical protein